MGLFTTLCCITMMTMSSLLFHNILTSFIVALLCAGLAGGHVISQASTLRAQTRGRLWMITGVVLAVFGFGAQYLFG